MLGKVGILTGLSVAALGLTSFPADSQTLQQGTQDAYIDGDNNEVNQTINQYYFINPGKGAIRRKESVIEPNNSLPNSSSDNVRPRKYSNREWGRGRGLQRGSVKK